jgi:4-hydroxy-tetrahydrodipicolinate synthase
MCTPECEIVLYNFEKLCGYKFSAECIQELVKLFPKQIIGVKDSSYNLFENLKIDNFSILPGIRV